MDCALSFTKMHGLGNDFVIVDGRGASCPVGSDEARLIADRHTGVGCDQVIVLDAAYAPGADVFMAIFNADGSEVGACGNAARCVAQIMMGELGNEDVIVETRAEVLKAHRDGTMIAVDMGPAMLDWHDIPLQEDTDTLHLPIDLGPLSDPAGTSMGNPHMTFFVDDLSAIAMEELGPQLEVHPLYPEKANVGVAQVLNRGRLKLRVWERGAGLTMACGTGACAAAVSAVRRELTDRSMTVELDGGDLQITWQESDGHVIMTGPTATVFAGQLNPELLSPS